MDNRIPPQIKGYVDVLTGIVARAKADGNNNHCWFYGKIAEIADLAYSCYEGSPGFETKDELATLIYNFSLCCVQAESYLRLRDFLVEEKVRLQSDIVIKIAERQEAKNGRQERRCSSINK